MPNETSAEEAVLQTTATKFDQAKDTLDEMLTRLLNELSGLQGAWVGKSGSSFTQVKHAYEENQKKIALALSETSSGIRSSGTNYVSTDTDTSSRVANINTGINLNL